ncbi:4Fe-4S binding protein [Eubacterium sp.]
MKNITPKMKKKMNIYLRLIIQIIFSLIMPSIFTTAFSGVKYIFTQIGNGQSIELTSFVTVLIVLCIYTIAFGRFFCGFACAFGSVGDWIHEVYLIICKKLKKKPLVINEKIRKKSTLVKYIILAAIVIICFCGVYSKTKGWSPWEVFSMLLAGNISLSTYVPAIIILLLIIVGMAVCERFFCRFLCPMGAVFSLLPILPFFSLGREREQCIKGCRACTNKCPSDIELPELGEDIQSGDCFMCQKCIDICPKSNVRTSVKKLRGNESMFTLIKVILLIILMKYAGV